VFPATRDQLIVTHSGEPRDGAGPGDSGQLGLDNLGTAHFMWKRGLGHYQAVGG